MIYDIYLRLGDGLMVSDAKSIFLAGVGAAAMTYEKASEVVDSLVKKGKITVDEGMELSKELKRDIKKNTSDMKEMAVETFESMKPLTKDDLKQILEELNYADKSDILELKRRIESLKAKIN